VGYCAHKQFASTDIGEPFDVAAFKSLTLPEEQNAFTYYRRAIKSYVSEEVVIASDPTLKRQDFENSLEAAEKGWQYAIPAVRRWVAVNAAARAEFQRGADCADSLQIPPAERSMTPPIPVELLPLRALARLELLEGLRLTAEGRTSDAWTCFRNLLRASRHLAMHGPLVALPFGTVFADQAVRGGVNWSAQKSVEAAELKKAICDVQAIEEMPARASDTIKLEYLALRDVSERGIVFSTPQPAWVRSTGYPAQVARTARLVVANLLTQADRPKYRRTPVNRGSLQLFELDAASAPNPQLLPPEEIEASAATYVDALATAMRSIAPQAALQLEAVDPQLQAGNLWEACLWHDVADTRRDGLVLALALQLHYREHGQFPASLDELAKKGYLKSIPTDPFGKGEPFRYRREPAPQNGAVLWSVWKDGIDQGGLDLHKWEGDWSLRISVPGTSDGPAK
jgi:hypothetical protein